MGVGYRFGMGSDPAVSVDSLNALLAGRGLAEYSEVPSALAVAADEARETETGFVRFDRTLHRATTVLGHPCLLQACTLLVPRMMGGVSRLPNGLPLGSLEAAWDEWLRVGESLGALQPGECVVPEDVFRAIQLEEGIDDASPQDAQLIEMKQAWLCYYEGLRVARLFGLALHL